MLEKHHASMGRSNQRGRKFRKRSGAKITVPRITLMDAAMILE